MIVLRATVAEGSTVNTGRQTGDGQYEILERLFQTDRAEELIIFLCGLQKALPLVPVVAIPQYERGMIFTRGNETGRKIATQFA